MFALFWPGLESASPVATLIASLFTVVVAAGLYALFRRWRGRIEKRSSAVETLIAFLRRLDRALVRTGSRWVGTRVVRPWPRRVVALGIFIFVAACGAFLPWPWCLWALSFGLFNVFVIFRHWSHDETEAKSQVSPEDKQIRIEGDLSAEMAGAVAFILVYATTPQGPKRSPKPAAPARQDGPTVWCCSTAGCPRSTASRSPSVCASSPVTIIRRS